MTEANPPDAYRSGGAAGTQHAWADFDELNRLLGKWHAECDRILADGEKLTRAIHLLQAPAGDPMSHRHAGAARQALHSMREHNRDLLRRTREYVERLETALEEMRRGEDANIAEIRRAEPD